MSARTQRRAQSRSTRTTVRGLWAFWFVAVALVAVVAVPAYFDARAADAQERIALLEEAGSLGARLSLLKAQQMNRLETFLLTGDRRFRDFYQATIPQEDSVFERLSVLSRELDFVVQERLSELQVETVAWRFDNQQAIQGDETGDVLARASASYADLQRSTRELDRAIQSWVTEGRRAVERARTLQGRLTVVLAILALAAAVVVGRVGWRFRDLSDEAERRRQDAVRARREIDALVEATGDGVLGIDLEGKCTSLNRAGSELLGYSEREIVGRDVHETLLHTRPDGTRWSRDDSPMLQALADGERADSDNEAILWGKMNRVFPARWSLRPMIDGTELRGAVLTFTDMTEIQEKEEALRRAIEQREDVVSIVSHDLRNPLGVVLAASDLLLDLPLDEDERRRQAQVIRRSGKRMQSLIEDLLDVARIEDGAFVVHLSTERLRPIIEEARAMFADQADRKRIMLEVDAEGDDAYARVDRDRIIQALANLLDNALRLTPEGGRIVLSVRQLEARVDVSVADTGPGIEPEFLERLFERYTQSNSSGGGTGLGLAIVRGVAEAHGGEVVVRSTPGRGATFTIRLPRADPLPVERPA